MSLVTIILPAYNAEKTIARAIESALSQEYTDLEVIVVDDGSSDSTLNVCKALADKDNRLKVLHINNSGPSAARNYGLSRANGEFICFMDADDEMSSTMISQMTSNMQDDIDLVACGYKVRSNNGEQAFEQRLDDKTYSNDHLYEFIGKLQEAKAFNPLWNKIFRRSIIDGNNLKMDTSVDMGEDFLFVVDYCEKSKKNYKTLSSPLYNYELSNNGLQVTANRNKNLDRRLSQLEQLNKIFNQRNYPMDIIYKEKLRILYTSLLESSDLRILLNEVNKKEYLNDFINLDVKLSGKYNIFLKILKIKHIGIVYLSIKLFKLVKKIQGKSFNWG